MARDGLGTKPRVMAPCDRVDGECKEKRNEESAIHDCSENDNENYENDNTTRDCFENANETHDCSGTTQEREQKKEEAEL
jgi:hypothetical protein